MRDLLGAPIKAAAGAAFTVGLLMVLLHPPSLSGAESLALLIVAAAVLFGLVAWGTVALSGHQQMSEPEFERLVRRSEELARRDAAAPPPTAFDELVVAAIDRLPEEFRRVLEGVPVVVSHRGEEHRAYGHYFGDTVARDNYPDKIVIYQDTLERDFGHDEELLAEQVERTVRHELAHHLGWAERGVRELGL